MWEAAPPRQLHAQWLPLPSVGAAPVSWRRPAGASAGTQREGAATGSAGRSAPAGPWCRRGYLAGTVLEQAPELSQPLPAPAAPPVSSRRRRCNSAAMAGAAGPLAGQVCVVTGASRGIGKGIALQLSEAGATVYITGRGREGLERAAAEVRARGGRCVPVQCDSTREEEVAALFERVRQEQAGRLDVLVNNAFSGVSAIAAASGVPFWECKTSLWDDINNAGLRGHYFCTVHAARLMVPAGRGLIVIISSPGGLRYMFDVPYGVGKAACDRLATDCAVELRPFGVASVALWPGFVRTEILQKEAEQNSERFFQNLKEKLATIAESTEVSGKCVVGLASDPQVMCHSGKVLLSPDLARHYRFKDVDGRDVFDFMSVCNVLTELMPQLSGFFRLIPQFIRIPKWVLALYSSRFAVYQPLQSPPPKSGKKT